MENVLIVFNGPMCAGKSTTVDKLMETDGYFRASSDRIKWLISNYSADIPDHRKIAKEITLSAISEAMKQGLSILVDGGHHEHRKHYAEIADQYGFNYISVNIEAPYETLKERFLKRVESARKANSQTISVTTLEGFDSRYNWYLETNKDENANKTLDSSKLSTAEIISEIKLLAS